MKDSIILSVSELRSLVKDIRRSGSDFVKLSIVDSEKFDGDVIPPSLEAFSCKKSDTSVWIDFEPIFEVDNGTELDEKESSSTHMSSNLL